MTEEHNFVKKPLDEEKNIESEKKNKKYSLIKKEAVVNSKKVIRKKIEDDLFEIYGDAGNKTFDMKKLQKKEKTGFLRSFFVFLFSLAFFLAIAWFGFFSLDSGDDFSEDDLNFSISGPEKIKIGETFSYRINYKNSQNIELKEAEIEVKYPKGFVFVSSTLTAVDENHTIWKLDNIKAHDSGYLDIEGQIYGNLDSEQSIRAFLNYVPENFNSEFQKVAHIVINAEESPIDVDLKIPENIYKNADSEFNLTISPQENKITNLKIVCESENMIFKSSNKESINNSCEWLIENLEKEETLTFTVDFADEVNSENNFNLKIYQIDKEKQSEYLIFEKEEVLKIIKSDFVFNLAINGVMSETTIKPGQTINSTIVVKNSGESVLEDVKINMLFDTPSVNNKSLLDWTKLNVEPYDADVSGEQLSATSRRGIISWNKNYVDSLAKIMPGQEVYLDFSISLKDNSSITLSDFVDSNIMAVAELEYQKDGKKEIKTGNKINLKVVSDLLADIMSEEGKNSVGNTVYKVTWLLSNSFHDLKNVVLVADIYGKTKVDVSKIVNSSGKVEYNEKENKIKWQIDSLPTNIPDAVIAQFEIELLEKNPSQEDLMSKVTISADDEKAGETIKFFGEEIKL
ncbi:MAG: hypothetical protein WC414_02120 [Patescibacteria group bacterium]